MYMLSTYTSLIGAQNSIKFEPSTQSQMKILSDKGLRIYIYNDLNHLIFVYSTAWCSDFLIHWFIFTFMKVSKTQVPQQSEASAGISLYKDTDRYPPHGHSVGHKKF